MAPSVLLLLGALLVQEPYFAPPDPENLWRVTRYSPLMFRGAETPFRFRQEFMPRDRIPDAAVLRAQAEEERQIIEVCRPRRTGAAGQWLWPQSLEERRRQCDVYGVSDERQP